MFTKQHSILQDELDGVKVDPALAKARRNRVFTYVAAAMLLTALILLFLIHESNPFASVIYVISILNCIFIITSDTKRVRYQERLEQRRQAAARGDRNLLASEQPQPDATALPLTITLRRRHSGMMYLRVLTIVLLLVLILSILVYIVLAFLFPLLYRPQLSPQTFTLIILGIFAFVFLLVVGLTLGILYSQEREQLSVTEYGLIKIGAWGKVHSVSWQQVRLFAIDGVYGLRKMDRIIPTRYELSSAHDIVHWGPLLDTAIVSAEASCPLQAQANYRQALHSLIAARTGLPLYDLREG